MEELKCINIEGTEYIIGLSASNDYIVDVDKYGEEIQRYNLGTNLADVYEFILDDAKCIIEE